MNPLFIILGPRTLYKFLLVLFRFIQIKKTFHLISPSYFDKNYFIPRPITFIGFAILFILAAYFAKGYANFTNLKTKLFNEAENPKPPFVKLLPH